MKKALDYINHVMYTCEIGSCESLSCLVVGDNYTFSCQHNELNPICHPPSLYTGGDTELQEPLNYSQMCVVGTKWPSINVAVGDTNLQETPYFLSNRRHRSQRECPLLTPTVVLQESLHSRSSTIFAYLELSNMI